MARGACPPGRSARLFHGKHQRLALLKKWKELLPLDPHDPSLGSWSQHDLEAGEFRSLVQAPPRLRCLGCQEFWSQGCGRARLLQWLVEPCSGRVAEKADVQADALRDSLALESRGGQTSTTAETEANTTTWGPPATRCRLGRSDAHASHSLVVTRGLWWCWTCGSSSQASKEGHGRVVGLARPCKRAPPIG